MEKDVKNEQCCLNCGSVLHVGNYCHVCGQPVNTGRLTMRNMGVNMATGLTRINSKFVFTIRGLLIRPWRVISQYIAGKRASYVAPVQLLLILIFIWLALPALLGHTRRSLAAVFGDKVLLSGDGSLATVVNFVVTHVLTSETLIFVLLLLPAVPIVKLTHRIAGIRRYNIAEYIVASLYLSCFIISLSLVFYIPAVVCDCFVGSTGNVFSVLQTVIIVVVLSAALYRSFASARKSALQKVFYVAMSITLSVIFYFLIFFALILIHLYSFDRL